MNHTDRSIEKNNEPNAIEELLKGLLLMYPIRVSEVCKIRMSDIDVNQNALRVRKHFKPDRYIDINEETKQLLSNHVKNLPSNCKYLFTKDDGSRFSMKELLLVGKSFPWEIIIADSKYDAHIKFPSSREIIVRKFIARRCFRSSNLISKNYREYLLDLLLDFLPENDDYGSLSYRYLSDWFATVKERNCNPIANFRWTVFMIKEFCDFLLEIKLTDIEGIFCLNYPSYTKRKFWLRSKVEV